MVPVLVLAVVAFVVIRSLMWVVAHDEGAGMRTLGSEYVAVQSYDPTVRLAPSVHDEARAFLLPAATEPGVVDVDLNADIDTQARTA
jgi:hypothetical protein